MNVTVSRKFLLCPIESIGIGKFPNEDFDYDNYQNSLFIVLGTPGYYGIFPLTINEILDEEVDYLNKYFSDKENPFFPLALEPLQNLLKVNPDKFLTFDMQMEVFEKESLSITWDGNQFDGKPTLQKFPFHKVFPDPKTLSRESWYLNRDAIKNIAKLTKDSVYFYTDAGEKMAYCPIGDEAFVSFSFRKNTAELWVNRPNTVLSKISSFSDGLFEDKPTVKSFYELELEKQRVKHRELWDDYERVMDMNALNQVFFGLLQDRLTVDEISILMAQAKNIHERPTDEEIINDTIQEDVTEIEATEPVPNETPGIHLYIQPDERDAVKVDAERLGIDLDAQGKTFQAIDEEEVLPTPIPDTELSDDDFVYDDEELDDEEGETW